MLRYNGLSDRIPFSRVVITIHQPRPYHSGGDAREWSITVDELRSYHAQLVARFAHLDTTQYATGPHCYKCAALPICGAARLASLNAVDVAISTHAENLPPDVLGDEMVLLERAADVIKQRLAALEAQALSLFQSGKLVKNYTVNPSYGNRRWNEGLTPETVRLLTGVDVTAPPEMITPAAAKRAGISDIVLNGLASRPFKGYQLTRDDTDKRAKKVLKP